MTSVDIPAMPGDPMKFCVQLMATCIVLHVSYLTAAEPPQYETDIRPILKAACFHCHGEEEEIEANLDLRLRRRIVAGGDSGPAIIVGDPKQSLLLQRIESGEMPPGKLKLTADEVSLIRQWIQAGATTLRDEPEEISSNGFTYEERTFWSFQPIVSPEVPTLQNTRQVRTPIDAFLLQRLQEQGLEFAPEADRQTLIRRLSYDLTGLPPTPEQVDAFLADDRPDAYERLVDELLASPHYGERWGRHWLDVTGYADSEGYTEDDPERAWAYLYRDYVVRSFNADKPFDQFIREQLAGDEMINGPLNNLSAADVEKLTATGFLRMVPDGTGSGGVDQNLARNQVISETLKVVSSALMGLTVGCAECHNHRYDPILQTDYYALRAIFEPALNWKQWRNPSARKVSLYTDEDRRIAAEIEAKAKLVDEQLAALTATFIDQTLEAQLLKLEENVRDPLRIAYKTAVAERTEEQKALLDKYPKILKISAGSLYLYDREIRTDAAQIKAERKQKEQEFIAAAQSQALSDLDSSLQTQFRAALALVESARSPEQQELLTNYSDRIVNAENLSRFDAAAAAELVRLDQAATDLLATLKEDRIKALQEQATEIRGTKPQEIFVRALTEVPGQVPETFLFHRGDYEQPKEKLVPAGLSVLVDKELVGIPENDSELPTTGRRLAFAQRLTDKNYPLTPRVLVNRFWMHHFGRGIVDTTGDLGYLGGRPTHPELLDWLADRFIQNGWKLKPLHKLILMSSAYRQSSRQSQEQQEIDPDNLLLGHFSLRRLEAETLRDAILMVSGKLNPKMFGPPVPVMEDAVGQIIIGKENLDGERKPLAPIDLNGEEYRRSLYVQVRRSRPLAVLAAFDLPEMEPNCTERSSSTVTPQALMLMNSDFAADHAEAFAMRVQQLAGDHEVAQCRTAWKLALGREANDTEIARSLSYLGNQRSYYEQNSPEGNKQTPATLALKTFCQAIFSSNAFLYVD